MRTKNSIKNISIGIFTQVIMTILGFISRKVFLHNLGITYLGVNGLLTNVLSMLGLLEAGIGSSIVYSLYKPLAEKDEYKITALMQLYKKAYKVLAVVVLIISVALYPILIEMMSKDETIANMSIVYMVFVAKNVLSYLYSYKWCIINADQKNYIIAKRNLIFNIVTTITKIIVLSLTKSYVLFLLIDVLIMIIQNISNGKVVDKLYPYINSKSKCSIDEKTNKDIVKNVKALFLHNIGTFCVFGTDNILISYFINVATVGIYSTYTMIIDQLTGLISPMLNGIGNSVGNLLATEGNEKNYEVFKVSYLINFWIYSLAVIFLYNLLNPFIIWWIGEQYLIDSLTFIVILVNCYISGMRGSIHIFKSKAGIFSQDKYVPLIESVVNLGTSIILVKYLGLAGIFLGTTISTICIVFWNVPRLVYKHVFKKSVIEYFKTYIFYIIITIIVGYITTLVCTSLVEGERFISLVLRGVVCILIPNLIYITIFYKTKEFQYILGIIKPMFYRAKEKIMLN